MTGSLGHDDRADRRSVGQNLLTQILDNSLEEDYRAVAEARGGDSPSSRGSRLRLLGVVAVFGVLISTSAVQTQQDRPQALVERAGLISEIRARQHRLDSLETQLRTLQSDVAALQTQAAQQSDVQAKLSGEVSTLGVAAGTASVRGPGIVITTDDGPSAAGSAGTIADSDLQALINSLWAAGAEAIAVNGHRLTPLTAIRLAGQAITVDYRSLRPPYVVQAIGNPNLLPSRLLQTQGGQLWLSLRANFGIRFTVRASNQITLPGQAHVSLLWARHRIRR